MDILAQLKDITGRPDFDKRRVGRKIEEGLPYQV